MSETEPTKSNTERQAAPAHKMLLHPASLNSTALKAALFGTGGSGKTITAMLLAVGLSKEQHNSAPIAFVDPEGVEEFVAPICAAEGVPLVVLRGRTFLEMRDGLTEAEQIGCCAYVVDHYDGIFRELTEAQKERLNLIGRKLPYQHREELIRVWDAWVRQFRASPLACIFTGRLAWEWGDSENTEDGEVEKVKLGTKMRGDSDAGYEPNLLIEMERVDNFKRDKISKRKQGEISHVARILKDRRMVLNGRSFAWKDLNAYQAGDYQTVYKAIAPHFALAVGAGRGNPPLDQAGATRSSAELFQPVSGESAYAERQRRITVASEEFQATSRVLWPGETEKAKACRQAAIEAVFQTRSWSAVEGKTAEAVEAGAALLRACEAALPREADGVAPMTRAETIAWISAIQTEQREATVL